MKVVTSTILVVSSVLWGVGCGVSGHTDPAAGAPPPAQVERDEQNTAVAVDHPEQFPLATAAERNAASQLTVTGVVNPDVSLEVPVVSLTSGRVLDVRARLGDEVKKGQLLLRVQSSDVSSAFADYRKAVADEALAQTQFDRAKELLERGAIAKKDWEVAQDAEAKARVDVETTAERLHVLGLDTDRPPSGVMDITAPASGVIIEQNVTNAASIKSLDSSPNLFTIADLSHVWIICDVYENDLSNVRVGDSAEIRLNAFPDRVITGRISNIGAMLDPTIRTAKVRVEVANPGSMRVGMFATATFRGTQSEKRVVVPATAILHLHDHDWVYVPVGNNRFQRKQVVGGSMLPGNMQELLTGVHAGERVVSNALVFQNTVE